MQKQPKRHSNAHKCIEHLLGPVATVFDGTETGSWRILRPEFEHWECFKCMTCQWFCPVDAIIINDSEENFIEFNMEYCKGCGMCANVCRRSCIRMVSEKK